jgi:hypothetical protein
VDRNSAAVNLFYYLSALGKSCGKINIEVAVSGLIDEGKGPEGSTGLLHYS